MYVHLHNMIIDVQRLLSVVFRIVPTAAAGGSRVDLSSPASDCHLSVWRPTDELRQLLREGRSFTISNLTAYPSR